MMGLMRVCFLMPHIKENMISCTVFLGGDNLVKVYCSCHLLTLKVSLCVDNNFILYVRGTFYISTLQISTCKFRGFA